VNDAVRQEDGRGESRRPELQEMKALTVMQPWAWLIVRGLMDIENRDWPTRFRGRIYVHASSRWDTADAHRTALRLLARKCGGPEGQRMWREMQRDSRPGCIVGEVDIVDCVTSSRSLWFTGKYGFVLANAVAYKSPIPQRGGIGLFELDPALAR